jgi:demethylmenaquinone methyltransferase/2-methoxy-6-polyprenyl-1,4-benzoquinol methylase
MSEISHSYFFDTQANTWHDHISNIDIERLYQIFLNKIPILKKPALDAGCGTGILLPILFKLNMKLFPVYELDLSLKMLIKNREYHKHQFEAEYTQADVKDLPFQPNYFNTILSFASFAHFQSKDRVIDEFWRVLNSDGILVILHLMGHDNLNQMHKRVGNEVMNDLLPPINKLASKLEQKKFRIIDTEDNEDIFLLIARK